MQKRITWTIVFVALFLLAGGLAFVIDMYFDLLWFEELGKSVIFTTILYAKSMMATGTLLIAFFFVYLNLWFAERGPGKIQIGIPTPTGQITAYTFPPQTLRKLIGLVAGLVALFFALRSADNWELVWQWLNRVDFGNADPVFGRDISFYFFTLPLLEEVVRLGLILCFISAAGILVIYHFKGILSLRLGAGRRTRSGAHLSMLGALVFLFLAGDAFLDRFEILYSNHGPMFGATYADLHARLPLLSALAALAVMGAILWVYNSFAGGMRAGIVSIALYGAGLLATNLYPGILQKFVVAPNELGREFQQIEYNIKATLRAYKLDQVSERNLSGDKALSKENIEANAATIRSIRLWDHQPLLDAFSQIQEIRTYYDFTSVDNDRYLINGEPQQVMLSARELNSVSLPERNWINEHLSYTHGYGITLGPVNRVTTEGLPVLLVQDIPPRESLPILKLTRPAIYYGEQTRDYAVVKTGAKEFDYPAGEENVYATYEGTGGVPIQSFWRKLLFAIYFKEPNIVLSPLLRPESRFLYYREVRSRMSRVAPFLRLDQDPYLVISQGKLYWIQDAYTVGDRYPYSTPSSGIGNYIRNSVKMVLDAYNGNVDVYISDPDDPLVRVYQKMFPGVFRPLGDMPLDLRNHIRYPEDIFRIQTYIFSVYHMSHPQTFYNREDLWEVPVLGAAGSEVAMSPYYTIMRLPQETKKEEFILMLPFTPGRKDNLSAWIVARSDGDQYGQLVVYRFPKKKLVYGPKQIAARINQDAEISRQISLWDQRGSQVIQGTLLVIPVDEGLLYVRPLYIRAESGKIPELKRVIVAYENKIAMEETLEASIARIFQVNVPETEAAEPSQTAAKSEAPSPTRPDTAALLRQAKEAYDRAISAQRQGDWARYGEEIKKLGEILDVLKQGK